MALAAELMAGDPTEVDVVAVAPPVGWLQQLARTGALQGAAPAGGRRRADPVPLRRLRRLLRPLARPEAGLFLRLLPRRRHGPGGGAGSQAGAHLQEADAARKASASSTSAPAGAACCCTRPRTTACRRSGITLSRNQHAYVNKRDPRARPGRPGADGPARLPQPAGQRAVRQDRLGRHVRACRPGPAAGLLRQDPRPAQARRAAAEPRHHRRRHAQPPARLRPGRVHGALHLPRRRAAARVQGARGDQRIGARGGRRREPAPALRARRSGPGATASRPTSRRRAASPPRPWSGPTGCIWPAAPWRSSAPGSRCTRCCARGAPATRRRGRCAAHNRRFPSTAATCTR